VTNRRIRATNIAPDLLQALEIVTELGVESRRDDLGVATILNILLPVKEPVGNFVLAGVGDNHHESLKLSGGELASPVGTQQNKTRR
jgi:hypothetical protein